MAASPLTYVEYQPGGHLLHELGIGVVKMAW